MRILRIAQDIFPETIGGLPYHIHALSRDQAARGHDVTVLSLSDDVDSPTKERRDGYTLVRYRPSIELFGNKLNPTLVRHLRTSDDYDIVHAHSHLYLLSSISAVLRHLSNTPLAVTCHGLTTQTLPHWFSNLHLRTMGRFTYNAADINFCYTSVEKQRLRDIGVNSDIQIVPNGIDPERFTPEGKEYEPIVRTDGPAVLFVGRLVPGKCPDLVIEAFERLRGSYPEAKLFICGDGPLRSELEQQADRLGISDRVEFLGYVSYETMPSIYRSADVLALPSKTEGFPRTVMEALACETPVVTSPLEQIKPLVKRSGRIAGDSEALTVALDELLADDVKRSRLGAAGRQSILSHHNWSTTVQQMTSAMKATIK